MARTGLQALFSMPVEPTAEEKEKDLLKNNPFAQKKSLNPTNGEQSLRLVLDNMGAGVEKHYFHFQDFLTKHGQSHFGIRAKQLYKLRDVFDASVSSSFHGQVGSKTSAMQQQISTYLTQIGSLTKTIFPMVREIRIMKERMSYYEHSTGLDKDDETLRQNEVTLKSTWVEMVEGGMQNPNSVYSMSTKLGFVTLPDLFFGINPKGKTPRDQRDKLHKILGQMEKDKQFNKKVRLALEKKLVQYYTWKETTWDEMRHTWKFRLKALKQHYNVIQLYISWLKPYMTSLKALQMRGKTDSSDIVGAFETSKLELELLAVLAEKGRWRGCVTITFNVRTKPELIFAGGGQRQVQHSGKIEIELRPYVATQEEIDFYKDWADRELFKEMSGVGYGTMINDIEAMLTGIGTDVHEYLQEAETGKKPGEEKKEEQIPGAVNPFTALKDFFKSFTPDFISEKKEKKESKMDIMKDEEDKNAAAGTAKALCWVLYEVFKKSNGMLAY